jgi:hypothetical protein
MVSSEYLIVCFFLWFLVESLLSMFPFIVNSSPFVLNMLGSDVEDISFVVNNTRYPRYYLLADGIYHPWSCFLTTIHEPQDEMRQHFKERHEACLKDVEHCFGVLQARFGIVQNPCKQWDFQTIINIMMTCVILHNMIIEDEQGLDLEEVVPEDPRVRVQRHFTFQDFQRGTSEIENSNIYFALRSDIIRHLWALKGATHHH